MRLNTKKYNYIFKISVENFQFFFVELGDRKQVVEAIWNVAGRPDLDFVTCHF